MHEYAIGSQYRAGRIYLQILDVIGSLADVEVYDPRRPSNYVALVNLPLHEAWQPVETTP